MSLLEGSWQHPVAKADWRREVGFGHRMLPGAFQKAHFELFRAFPIKWAQEVSRRLILQFFWCIALALGVEESGVKA